MPGSAGRSSTGLNADQQKKPGRGEPLPGSRDFRLSGRGVPSDDQLQQGPPPQQSLSRLHKPPKIRCRKHSFFSSQQGPAPQTGAGAAHTGAGAAQIGAGAAQTGAAHFTGAGAQQLGFGAQHFGAGAQHFGAGATHFGAGAQHFAGGGAQQSSWPWPNRPPNRPASALLLPRQQIIKAADRVIHFIPGISSKLFARRM